MKKMLFLITIVALLFAACGTTPDAPPPPPPPPEPIVQNEPPPQPPVVQEQQTSDRHPSGILLTGSRSYTVRQGDTLSQIAWTAYTDGSLYPLISMVSGEVEDVDEIEIGMNLTIPDAAANFNDSVARAAINRYFETIARLEDQRGRPGTAEMIRNHIR